MSARVHCGTSLISRQPKSSEFSTPTITASLPCAAMLRTCAGRGGDAEPALARAAALRVDVVLHRVQVLGLGADLLHLVAARCRGTGYSSQITRFATSSALSTRWPDRHDRSMPRKYDCSCSSELCCGQSPKVGQPSSGRVHRVGAADDRLEQRAQAERRRASSSRRARPDPAGARVAAVQLTAEGGGRGDVRVGVDGADELAVAVDARRGGVR